MSARDPKPRYRAWFEALHDPSERYPLDEVAYTARDGSLLQVVHDLDELRKTPAEEWKRLFEERAHKNEWPYGSGVWGKKEWVCPDIDNENIVSMYEGHSNLFWAERYGRELGLEELWIKQCGNSHTGSFKDLGMTVLVSVVRMAIRDGLRVKAIACASTGDTSAALAAYGAAAGLPVVVLLPRGKISTAQLAQPLAHGALVLGLDTDFDGCMAIVQRLAAEGIVYLANSMNPLRLEGQKTVAIEIVQQFDWQVPDWVILPSGNLGNASALYAGFRMMRDLGVTSRFPRLVVAQAENANPLYRAWHAGKRSVEPIQARPTLATAIQIGNPVSAPRAIAALEAMDGLVEQASEEELCEAAARADRTGMYTCPHTAVGLAVLEKLVHRGVIRPEERVVCISTAAGLKFTEFKVRYHERSIDGVSAEQANPPTFLPPDFGRVVDAIDARFS